MAPFDSAEPIIIADDGDLTLRIYELDSKATPFISINGAKIKGLIQAKMKVSRKVLIDHSSEFKEELMSKPHQSVLDVEADFISKIEIPMRVLHDAPTDKTLDISIEEVWEILEFCMAWKLNLALLHAWFAAWMGTKSLKDYKLGEMLQLLTPCHEFNYLHGFAYFTRHLVYNLTGYIREDNPTYYRHIHLHGNAITALNGAKGTLYGMLSDGIVDPIAEIDDFMCSCSDKTIRIYLPAVKKTGILPLQHKRKRPSLFQILNSAGICDWSCEAPVGTCKRCLDKLSAHQVLRTRMEVLTDFDGLCLNCMTKSKSGDLDKDYWEHDIQKDWSKGCGWRHGQSTWFRSFSGRKTDMIKHNEKKKSHMAKHGNLKHFFD